MLQSSRGWMCPGYLLYIRVPGIGGNLRKTAVSQSANRRQPEKFSRTRKQKRGKTKKASVTPTSHEGKHTGGRGAMWPKLPIHIRKKKQKVFWCHGSVSSCPSGGVVNCEVYTCVPGARIHNPGAAARTRLRALASVAPTTRPTLLSPFQLQCSAMFNTSTGSTRTKEKKGRLVRLLSSFQT